MAVRMDAATATIAFLATASRPDAVELGLEVAAFRARRSPRTLDECRLEPG